MGIFDALTTAVTGMQAQSFALQNISGNIANSQTTAFKRVDTAFEDLIPDAAPSKQTSGNVVANSRATNNVQGDIQTASVSTFMAINGDGFFVVEKPSSFTDGRPVFDGIDMYTRRGDFQPDKNGYLVNGAGYYLMGIPIDPTTGNLTGSVPQLLQFQNDFLPAQPTTEIDYRANLASYPLTPAHDANVPKSELLDPTAFSANPIVGAPAAAKITGTGATLSNDASAVVTGTQDVSAFDSGASATTLVINSTNINIPANSDENAVVAAINTALSPAVLTASLSPTNQIVLTSANADTNIVIGSGSTSSLLTGLGLTAGTTLATNILSQSAAAQGQTMTITIGGNPPYTITFGTGPTQVSTLAELNGPNGLGGLVPGLAAAASVDTSGNITITAANSADKIVIGTGPTDVPASNFGIHVFTAWPASQQVIGADVTTFLDQSIGGGAVTAYDQAGSPVNIQLRWAKIKSSTYGDTDTWNLFYQVNSNATGNQVAWQNALVNYTFDSSGQLSPLVANVTLPNVTVNGIPLGSISLVHGSGGITQFADSNGNVQVNLLQQNGFPAGELQSVAVNDKGRVVGSYSNGRTIDLAAITLAAFNSPNNLKRADGGAFEVTDESGPATFGASGKIAGSSLEGSNTDIADEFSKLIVTQQAYSANTRIITTGNQMIQDLLNMIR